MNSMLITWESDGQRADHVVCNAVTRLVNVKRDLSEIRRDNVRFGRYTGIAYM